MKRNLTSVTGHVNQPQGLAMIRAEKSKTKAAIVYAVPAVERAIRIFQFLRGNRSASVSTISDELKITRSNCFAILKTLHNLNFLTFDSETKKYGLGLAFLDISRAIIQDLSIIQVARPSLSKLVARTGLSALLAQRIGETRLMVLDQDNTSADIRLTVELGRRIPITYSATGRAMLAFLADEQVQRLVSTIKLVPTTPKTMIDAKEILRDVQLIRERGYSVAYEESMIGVTALGAPVFDSDGKPAYSLTILGIAAAIPKGRIPELGREISKVAADVTAAIGGQSLLRTDRRR